MEKINRILADICTVREESGDYRDETGLLRCGKCGGYKERIVEVPENLRPGGKLRVKNLCPCEQEQEDRKDRERERRRFETHMDILRREGITDPKYLKYTFGQDDGRNPKMTKTCLRYVENWKEMRENNIGILFYGGVGTGKTFFAAAIANELTKKLVSAGVTNFPWLLNSLQGRFQGDRQEYIDRMRRYSLLVIDDLGAERNTEFSAEMVYNVIDTRYRSGKPLIITTNLTLSDLEKPEDLTYRRIYDRVLEMCPIRLKLNGESRRKENAEARTQLAREILGRKECSGNTN